MADTLSRLPDGGSIDRNKPINFFFNGKRYAGYEGDTIASALIANGVRLVGRSFKYHRPRGVFSAGIEECNAIVQVGKKPSFEPNVRATMAPLEEGMEVFSQNSWPSVKWDVFAILGLLSRFLPPGFYYKTFKWPSWKFYEGIIRHTAGMGVAPTSRDDKRYTKRNAHCDVLVVGGGPAGLSAARSAARSGARVFLVDEHSEMGGALLRDEEVIDGKPALEWRNKVFGELKTYQNVTVLSRCTVTGYYDHNLLAMVQLISTCRDDAYADGPSQRLWKVRAKQVVLATGAIERPIVFPNNDRPGVMLASAVRTYLKRFAVAPGRKVVVVTNNSDAYRTAIQAHTAGIEVVAIVDIRERPDDTWVVRAKDLGITVALGQRIFDTRGYKGIKSVLVGNVDGTGAKRWLSCDLVAMSGGWTPTVHLYSQNAGKLEFDRARDCFLPSESQDMVCTGSIVGAWQLSQCLQGGAESGSLAAKRVGLDSQNIAVEKCPELELGSLKPLDPDVGQFPRKQWVDFLYDVTVADVCTAATEQFLSVEHFKRYTTNGMAVDQGKTSNVNGLSILAKITGRDIPAVGTTKFRPPYTPITFGTLAGLDIGHLYSRWREMPCHQWHVANQAHFDDVGNWQRPACYPRDGESLEQAIHREIEAVRRDVGIFEGSPLGKIEVKGPDAAEFLHRIYMNNVHSLKEGKIRYALMLNDFGSIIDDGVFCKVCENHYLLYPTSAGADRVSLWLEEWSQTAWPELDVIVSTVSEQWATVTVSGPKARALMRNVESDINFSANEFPHMSYRTGHILGVVCRISRVSFTGELTYEINVPAAYGNSLWDALFNAGKPLGITPYGGEALLRLRLEKGFLHIGGDTDSTTIPDDIGWGAVAMKKETDYVGKRSLSLPVHKKSGRLQLVGFELLDAKGQEFIDVGAHVVAYEEGDERQTSIGYVTSSCYSPTLGKPVAIGRLKDGRKQIGNKVQVYSCGITRSARVVAPVFYDPEGDRINA